MNNIGFPNRAGRFFLGCVIAILSLKAGAETPAGPRQTLGGQVPAAVTNLGLRPIEHLAGTNRLDLSIALPLRNTSGLARLLEELYARGSANYHQFLSTEQFTERYGPSESDIQTVINFANAHGLNVTATYPNRMIVGVSASAFEIEAAFHVVLQVYQHPTENRTFYAPEAEPSLDLSVPVLQVSGLNNYSLPRPRLRATLLKDANGAAPLAGSGPSGTYMGYDFRAAYLPGYPLGGSGQSLGLVEFDGYAPADISYYETKAGLPSVTLSNVLIDGFNGHPTGNGQLEVSLDMEMAISMAPGLSQLLVYMAKPGGSWHDLLNRMASDNLAKQLSCSWYIPGGGPDPVADQIFQEMAAQGQAFFSASGDNDAYVGPISFPDDNPYITEVGGTTLTTSGPQGSWVSERVWNQGNGIGSGGGISTSYAIPSYQMNIDMTANQGSYTKRNVPDVAMVADNVYVRSSGQDYNVGGTSCSAPLWAGLTALINEAALDEGASVVGFINPAVYAIGKTPGFTANFHDITVGNNESPSSPSKFSAVPGYDLCTGWGTPLGSNLIYSIGVPEPLHITPNSAFLFTGPVGGPFTPASQIYTLTNKTSGSLDWSVTADASWPNVSPGAGTLRAGGPSTDLTVKPNLFAANFAPGAYTATLMFSNHADSVAQIRQVTLAIVTPPIITAQPASAAAFQGMTAGFTVGTASNALQYYRWQFDNGAYQTNLTDGGSISGSSTATLTISNVSPANVGGYTVIVTNITGSATSALAYLTIVPWRPVVTVQPVSQTILPGSTTAFGVGTVGTQPFTYRWLLNGTGLTDGGAFLGSSSATLTVSNATAATVGTYSVIVSNNLGMATSAGATLALVQVTAPGVALDTLYSFADVSIGLNPVAGLSRARDGSFYGTAVGGGAPGFGTVFHLSTNGTVSLVHAFTSGADGATPASAAIQANNGALYGVTYSGGAAGYGTLYRMSTSGANFTLASLNNTTSGANPVGGVVQARDGNFYGPSLQGGLSGYGTLFRAAGNIFSTLSSFNGDNGAFSSSLLIQAADGFLYGTAQSGGTNGGWGTIYRTTTAGVVTPLASFNYTNGATPAAGLVQDTDGAFYGTTYYGGAHGAGSVFKLATDGTLTSLYSFSGTTDGSNPFGGLLLSSDGNLYGTTESGGQYSSGTVFRISPTGTLLTIAHFDGFQGATPECTLVQGVDGNIYGTTAIGGQAGQGAIFRLTINSPLQITRQPQTQQAFLGDTVMFNVATFGSLPVTYQWRKGGQNVSDGGNLFGSNTRTLTLSGISLTDAAVYSVLVSNLSGSVTSAGAALQVIVSPPHIVSGPYDQTVLVGATAILSVDAEGDEPLSYQWQKNGTNITDGGSIRGSTTDTLTITSATADNAGVYWLLVSNALDTVASDPALLTVLPVIQPGAGLSTVHSFNASVNGLNPYAGLIQSIDGSLYGTTISGGSSNYGTIFRISPTGLFFRLHSFVNGPDGAHPFAGLVQGRDGFFYGATLGGGTNLLGNLFRMDSFGGSFSSLYSFQGGNDGKSPGASLVQGKDGNFYGTAYQGGASGYGSVFSLATNGALTPLAEFYHDNGANPVASLIQGTNSLLYGVAYGGGAKGYGTVFTLPTNGPLTTLVSFNQTNGALPAGALLQGKDGAFYGTTSQGGTNGGWGTVFRMTANGALTTLYSFGYDDGATPAAGLIQATDGNLYGTTSEGGWGGQGTMFRLTTNGGLTTVLWFNGANGANPQCQLVQAQDGSFYGTAEYGGVGYNGAAGTGNGLVFRLVLPMFISNPFTQAVATVTVPYSASLLTNTILPTGDAVSFAKVSGPAWLTVGSDGTLSGTPALTDIGVGTFAVTLFDTNGWSANATMSIAVVPTPWITASITYQGPNLWLTWSGRTAPYQVQMAANPVTPSWTTIAGPLYTNRMLLSPTASAAYYRIQGQ
jgi:uncharacterized repeat protein (TIGR03803 family)